MSRLKLERLLKIYYLLRSGIRQTQGSLAEATEVSDRNIRDDLAFLRDRYNAPLDYQKNKGWHYTLFTNVLVAMTKRQLLKKPSWIMFLVVRLAGF